MEISYEVPKASGADWFVEHTETFRSFLYQFSRSAISWPASIGSSNKIKKELSEWFDNKKDVFKLMLGRIVQTADLKHS